MSDELLRIENVTKKYGKTVANSDISFSVNAGETAVLLGPNGSGQIHHNQVHRGPAALFRQHPHLRRAQQDPARQA